MRIAGASTTRAPSPASERARPLACARALVTATLRPDNGRGESHPSSPASEATCPTTVTDGGFTSASLTAAAIVPSVPVIVRWPGSVPASTTAAGSSAGLPACTSAAAISGSARTPM